MCVCVCVCVCIHLPVHQSAYVGCYTRTILRWTLTGLNSEFPFSQIGCHTNG